MSPCRSKSNATGKYTYNKENKPKNWNFDDLLFDSCKTSVLVTQPYSTVVQRDKGRALVETVQQVFNMNHASPLIHLRLFSRI